MSAMRMNDIGGLKRITKNCPFNSKDDDENKF
jgi:hypothetical protein